MEEKLFSAVTIMTPMIYKDFYKLYYKERLKVFTVITTIIAVVAIVGAFMMYYGNFPLIWAFLALWIGVFLLVYPHVAYRKPYKKARDTKQTTRFAFYDTHVLEKTNSRETDYKYSELMKILETDRYLFIFHSIESVSIVDKENVKNDAEKLAEFLRTKATYKRVK